MRGLFVFIAGAILSSGCSGPSVRLSTPEPIVVDINMRVDVYRGEGEEGSSAASRERQPRGDLAGADARRRARTGDIQTLKNSRLIGESRDGLLVVLSQPEGSYGEVVARNISEENADRMILMQQAASERGISLDEVQRQRGELWRNRSFRGEWIQAKQDNQKWKWMQKP